MHSKLISSLVGAAFIVAAGGLAGAADMAVKAPPKPVAPPAVYSWTGFYVGANGGYGWKDPTVTFTPNDANAQGFTCGGAFGGTCAPPASFGINGGFGGLQAGYNWQLGRQWVAGLETDFDWSDIKGTGTSNFFLGGTPPKSSNFSVSQDVKWFGTVRGRLGYLPTDHLSIYATGGFAYGRIDENVALNSVAGANGTAITPSAGFGFVCASGANCFLGNSSRTGTGWTAGGGAEYVLWNNISVKAEYLFVNLGSGDNVNVVALLPSTAAVCAAVGGCARTSFTAGFSRTEFHTVRGGLNWKF
jgi:outer membrane immunogenic protein